MLLVLTAALALAAAEPATAAEPVTVAPATAVAPPKDGIVDAQVGQKKVKMVCKEVTKANSRFGKRQCYELEAYKRQQEIDRRAFEETQNRPVVSTARGN